MQIIVAAALVVVAFGAFATCVIGELIVSDVLRRGRPSGRYGYLAEPEPDSENYPFERHARHEWRRRRVTMHRRRQHASRHCSLDQPRPDRPS